MKLHEKMDKLNPLNAPKTLEHGAWLSGLLFIHERPFCMTNVIGVGKVLQR
jgi:hypothetical protein